ncbi:hypothetical protein [Agarivorans sp. Z349TD_8]
MNRRDNEDGVAWDGFGTTGIAWGDELSKPQNAKQPRPQGWVI